MSFLEHLEELRKRLLRSVYAIAAAFAVCLTYARKILDFFIDPIRSLPGKPQPVFLDLTEPFLLYMKVAFLASLFLSAPLVLYQVWAFIRPGLYARERRYALRSFSSRRFSSSSAEHSATRWRFPSHASSS